MDPVVKEIFAQVSPALPYVIGVYAALWIGLMGYVGLTMSRLGVYAALWIGLMGYVGLTMSRLGKLEKHLALVEEALAKRG